VVWTAEAVRRANWPGVRDVVPAFHSLAVYFDPLRADAERLRVSIEAAASASRDVDVTPSTLREVPVWYGGEHGPDLDGIAQSTGLSRDEVIAIHTAPTYCVFMIGFTPGFAYLGPVDPRIATPRLATPRVRVPAGSVGIAGQQTGIYPSETPGGWRLIGRTPFRPFQPLRQEPFLLKPGDAVRFVPIDAREYRRQVDRSGGGPEPPERSGDEPAGESR
jgi:KipI family sensor histidine kinase inhibitor